MKITATRHVHPQKIVAAKRFYDRWAVCVDCELSALRHQPVLFGGRIPAHVLLVGEAPGETEDATGYPFVGEAGDELDRILTDVVDHLTGRKCSFPFNPASLRFCVTNVVACVPFKVGVEPIKQPTKAHIAACDPRLVEFVNLVEPRVIVAMGRVAESVLKTHFAECDFATFGAIAHPSNIARKKPGDRVAPHRRAVHQLVDLIKTEFADESRWVE